MRAFIERVASQRVEGWAYMDGAPAERLTMSLLIDGQVVAESRADVYREDLKRNGLGDGFYGYVFADLARPDLPSAFLDGRIEVRALSAESSLIIAEPAKYLRDQTEGLLRSQALENRDFDEFVSYIIGTQSLDPIEALRSLDILNASRAHFPEWTESAEFLRAGASLAKRAGRTRTVKFYSGLTPGWKGDIDDGDDFQREPLPAVYGTLTEWCEGAGDLGVRLLEPKILGVPNRPSFLEESGLLTQAKDNSGPLVLAFREEAFGEETWWVKRQGEPVPTARNLYYMDFELLRATVEQGGFVVIDMSNEGPLAEGNWIEVLNRALRELQIPARQAVLVNQNLRFGQLGSAMRFAGHVTIAHYFVTQFLHVLIEQFPDDAARAAHCQAVLSARRRAIHLRHYICLNFTPRWFRWATVLHLSLHGQLAKGYVSFPGETNFKMRTGVNLQDEMPQIQQRKELLAHVPTLLQQCPLSLDVPGAAATSPDFEYPLDLMKQSLVHIVTESEMRDRSDMLRVTEKILKPIVGLQPFIVIGNSGSLALLRSMGFRTFDTLIDESYDLIQDPARRLNAIFHEIDRLTMLPIEDLKHRVEALSETVIFNFHHLLTVGPLLFNEAVRNRLGKLLRVQSAAA